MKLYESELFIFPIQMQEKCLWHLKELTTEILIHVILENDDKEVGSRRHHSWKIC